MKVMGAAAARAFLFDAGIVKSFAQASVVNAKKVTGYDDDGLGSRAKAYLTLKNIAIGCASGQVGKRQVHGYLTGPMPPGNKEWASMPMQDQFMELMADSCKATVDYFGKHIVFLNVLRCMSVDCDCAGVSAAEPRIADLDMVASTDILAVDQASVDLIYDRKSSDKHDLIERIESRHGLHQLQAMRDLKMGNDKYELISID